MKKIIEIFFKIFNFHFYTPLLDTYGDFISDLVHIEKIRHYKNSFTKSKLSDLTKVNLKKTIKNK